MSLNSPGLYESVSQRIAGRRRRNSMQERFSLCVSWWGCRTSRKQRHRGEQLRHSLDSSLSDLADLPSHVNRLKPWPYTTTSCELLEEDASLCSCSAVALKASGPYCHLCVPLITNDMDRPVYSPITFICFKTTLPLLNTERERARERSPMTCALYHPDICLYPFCPAGISIFFLKDWDEPKTKLVLSS